MKKCWLIFCVFCSIDRDSFGNTNTYGDTLGADSVGGNITECSTLLSIALSEESSESEPITGSTTNDKIFDTRERTFDTRERTFEHLVEENTYNQQRDGIIINFDTSDEPRSQSEIINQANLINETTIFNNNQVNN